MCIRDRHSTGNQTHGPLYETFHKYRTAGVRKYWIVNPEKNRITVYSFEYDDTRLANPGSINDLELDFNSINI